MSTVKENYEQMSCCGSSSSSRKNNNCQKTINNMKNQKDFEVNDETTRLITHDNHTISIKEEESNNHLYHPYSHHKKSTTMRVNDENNDNNSSNSKRQATSIDGCPSFDSILSSCDTAADSVSSSSYSSSSSSAACLLFDLNADALAHILLFCDFPSAVQLVYCVSTTTTSNSNNNTLCQEFQESPRETTAEGRATHLWKAIWNRHGFAPSMSTTTIAKGTIQSASTLVQDILYRRQLEASLLMRQKQQRGQGATGECKQPSGKLVLNSKSNKNRNISSNNNNNNNNNTRSLSDNNRGCMIQPSFSPFSLVDRCFSFLPLFPKDWTTPFLPDDDNNQNGNDTLTRHQVLHNIAARTGDLLPHPREQQQQHQWVVVDDDPPPVTMECDGFLLLNPATSPEWMLLDPFHGTLAWYDNVMDHCAYANSYATTIYQDARGGQDDDEDDLQLLYGGGGGDPKPPLYSPLRSSSSPAGGNDTSNSSSSVVLRSPPEPVQEFLSMQQFWDLPLHEYFGVGSNNNNNDYVQHRHNAENPDFEVEISYLGTECKTVINFDDEDYSESLRNPTVQWTHNSSSDSNIKKIDTNGTHTSNNVMRSSPRTRNPPGTMVSLGRALCRGDNVVTDQEDSVTEVLTWYRSKSSNSRLFADPRVCRLKTINVWTMELCAVNNRLFVCYGQTPEQQQQQQQELAAVNNNNNNRNDTSRWYESGSSLIHVYPLIPYPDELERAKFSPKTFFPDPLFVLDCNSFSGFAASRSTNDPTQQHQQHTQQNIVSMACTPSGQELIVGTQQGCLQVWSCSVPDINFGSSKTTNNPVLLQHISVSDAIDAALRCRRRKHNRSAPVAVHSNSNHDAENIDDNDDDDVEDLLLFRNARTAPVEAIRMPLDSERAGFVTLHHNRRVGNTVLLWKKNNDKQHSYGCNVNISKNRGGGSIALDTIMQKRQQQLYHVEAVINLPLLTHREPKLHYDGRRLIVFGQDHIGYIVLIYHIHSFQESVIDSVFSPIKSTAVEKKSTLANKSSDYGSEIVEATVEAPSSRRRRNFCEASGGVVHLCCDGDAGLDGSNHPSVRFCNRIRHAALDGILNYESIHMTVNERFLIFNTKAGHHLASNFSSLSEGLLVIDLQQQNK